MIYLIYTLLDHSSLPIMLHNFLFILHNFLFTCTTFCSITRVATPMR